MRNWDTEELHTFAQVLTSWSGINTETEIQHSESRAHKLTSFCALVHQLCYVKAFQSVFAPILYSAFSSLCLGDWLFFNKKGKAFEMKSHLLPL